jgi:hypothetical protein
MTRVHFPVCAFFYYPRRASSSRTLGGGKTGPGAPSEGGRAAGGEKLLKRSIIDPPGPVPGRAASKDGTKPVILRTSSPFLKQFGEPGGRRSGSGLSFRALFRRHGRSPEGPGGSLARRKRQPPVARCQAGADAPVAAATRFVRNSLTRGAESTRQPGPASPACFRSVTAAIGYTAWEAVANRFAAERRGSATQRRFAPRSGSSLPGSTQ